MGKITNRTRECFFVVVTGQWRVAGERHMVLSRDVFTRQKQRGFLVGGSRIQVGKLKNTPRFPRQGRVTRASSPNRAESNSLWSWEQSSRFWVICALSNLGDFSPSLLGHSPPLWIFSFPLDWPVNRFLVPRLFHPFQFQLVPRVSRVYSLPLLFPLNARPLWHCMLQRRLHLTPFSLTAPFTVASLSFSLSLSGVIPAHSATPYVVCLDVSYVCILRRIKRLTGPPRDITNQLPKPLLSQQIKNKGKRRKALSFDLSSSLFLTVSFPPSAVLLCSPPFLSVRPFSLGFLSFHSNLHVLRRRSVIFF